MNNALRRQLCDHLHAEGKIKSLELGLGPKDFITALLDCAVSAAFGYSKEGCEEEVAATLVFSLAQRSTHALNYVQTHRENNQQGD